MKQLLILFILLSFSLNVWGSELKSGIRVGYNLMAGMQVQFYEKTTGKFAQIDNYQYDNLYENLYLSYLTTPNYLYNGLGWLVKLGYNDFQLQTQRFILTAGSAPDGRGISLERGGDLGSRLNGRSIYFVPSLFYHFFRENSISLILELGLGLSYNEINGNIYITDSFEIETRDSDCYNYLSNNDSFNEVGVFCDLKSVNLKGRGDAWSPRILIKGENVGLEFGWVQATLEEGSETWWVNDVNMGLFYQFNFD